MTLSPRTLLSAALALSLPAAAMAEPGSLTIGDKAPKLDIEHWFSTGSGFDKVSDFEPGRVYVVEFWATWCGPCIGSMPSLAELQEKYADKGVQIVSISDEPKATVEKFLDRKLPGVEEPEEGESEEGEDAEESAEPTTYGELTGAYSLTTDPDESTYKDYMEAAFQNGIPCCFIVGKTGEVEWIGHPMLMKRDGILDDVLDGSFDRESFKQEFEDSQKYDRLQAKVFGLLEEGEGRSAVEALEQFGAENDDAESNPMFKRMRMIAFQAAGDVDGFTRMATADLEEASDPVSTIQAARAIGEAAMGMTLPKQPIEAAVKAVNGVTEDLEGGIAAFAYDTLGLLHQAAGDLDAAIAAQKKAVEAAKDEPRLLPRLKAGLKRIEAAKKEAGSSDE